MREVLRWWGIRVGGALFLGAVVSALTGRDVFVIVAFGIVMWVVCAVAAEAYVSRGIRWEPSGDAGDAVPPADGAGPGAGDGCGGGFDGGGGFGGGDGGGGGGGC